MALIYLRPPMKDYPKVIIRDKRIDAIKRRHPWIFSGAVRERDSCTDGDVVEVRTRRGEFLAVGYFQDSSIMVRILSFEPCDIDEIFWRHRLNKAIALRNSLGLPSDETDAYRLIHGEGDGLPGLIIDIYGRVAVLQCHAIGIHRMINDIAQALKELLGHQLDAIYVKSGNTLPRDYASEHSDGFIYGDTGEVQIKEYGISFIIDVIGGQKTGFFLDQRENRALLRSYAHGKKVLNLFSYTGGFSMYALSAGASEVTSVDVSSTAIALCECNAGLSGHEALHNTLVADVNAYLKEISEDLYDIIVVDPPAFAKSVRKRHNAVQAYKRVNAAAISKVRKEGLIFTFSCSQVIDAALFYHTIMAAGIAANRPCQVIHHLSQGPDHPVSLFHPEGKYLKGLVLKVD